MFPKGLIISSQALEGNPMLNADALARMAYSAVLGGASAIRANGHLNIAAMRKLFDTPIIGIDKRKDATGRTVITPDFAGVKAIADAGADIIALDATDYPSEIRENRRELIKRIHDELGLMVMADISTADEAYKAAELGADAVSTTLSGYIPGALHSKEERYIPDFKLIEDIVAMNLGCALVAEGRIWERKDLETIFAMGADAAVIGKAVTNPMAITEYFNTVVPKEKLK